MILLCIQICHTWFTNVFFFLDIWRSLLELRSSSTKQCSLRKACSSVREIKYTWGTPKYHEIGHLSFNYGIPKLQHISIGSNDILVFTSWVHYCHSSSLDISYKSHPTRSYYVTRFSLCLCELCSAVNGKNQEVKCFKVNLSTWNVRKTKKWQYKNLINTTILISQWKTCVL